MKKVAILTSGGDAPGMNAAIRAAVRTAIYFNMEVVGIRKGYLGMISGDMIPMDRASVGNILQRGGTILQTARSDEFKTKEGQDKAVTVLKEHGIEGVVVIGGDGSFRGAKALNDIWGIPTIAIPATIDNDICGTDFSIGFDTAVNTVINAINNIKDTASSHNRVFIVQVMGRNAGHLALESCLAGGAEEVVLPEFKFDMDKICDKITAGQKRGKLHCIVLVAEGVGSAYGIGDLIAHRIGFETRIIVLGHLQRGGSPTAFDRIIASKTGYAAVNALKEGEKGKMVGIIGNRAQLSDIEEAWKHEKELDSEMLRINEILAM